MDEFEFDKMLSDFAELQADGLPVDAFRAEADRRARVIKLQLLSHAPIQSGAFVPELRLLPGRRPGSRDPDDYVLLIVRRA